MMMKGVESMTQKQAIVAYLRANGSMTPMDAFDKLHITKLATRVSELRRDGVEITGQMEHGKTSYGECNYMRYRLGAV